MKQILLSAAMLLIAALAQAQTTESKPAAGEQSEWLPSFASVVVAAPLDITFIRVSDNEAPKIVYDTKGSYTTKFKAEVKDKVLYVNEKADSRRPERTTVKVYYNSLESIRISDATATFEGLLTAPMLDITVGGQAVVTAQMDVRDLTMDLSGRSSATLSGKARYLSLTLSTGKVDASQLEVMAAWVNVSTSGSASLWVTDRLEAVTSTRGQVTYKGAPSVVRTSEKFMGGTISKAE